MKATCTVYLKSHSETEQVSDQKENWAIGCQMDAGQGGFMIPVDRETYAKFKVGDRVTVTVEHEGSS